MESSYLRRAKQGSVDLLFPLYSHLVQYPKWYLSFWNERKLYRGEDVSTSDRRSVILFTTHKSASTFLKDLLVDVADQTEMVQIDMDGYFSGPNRDLAGYDDPAVVERVFHSRGYVYGPSRAYQDIDDLPEYRVVLVLRDPRDVLVSRYYSMRYSHTVISPNIVDLRKKARDQTIDEFVLSESDIYESHYHDYLEEVYRNDSVETLFFRYQDMIYDSETFLDELEPFTGADLPDERRRTILEEELSLPEEEDEQSHRRSGVAGQYGDELEQETIDELNRRFEEPLEAFGFGLP